MTALLSRAAPHALLLSGAPIVVLLSLIEPAFLGASNLIGILRSVALIGIMALGMTFVTMTGKIDLSVGPVSAIAGLVAWFTLLAGHGVVTALLAGAGLGLLIGSGNGLLVASLGLPPIIVTLGTLSIVRGSALLLGGPGLHAFRHNAACCAIGAGKPGGVPVPVLIFLALAGMIRSAQVQTASATFGRSETELDVIAAVVMGGNAADRRGRVGRADASGGALPRHPEQRDEYPEPLR